MLNRDGRHFSSAFLRDERALAAVEFALILPLMLLIYLGSFDVSREAMAAKKAGVASETVAEIMAQQSTATALTSAQVASILAASSAAMAPFSTTPLATTISGINLAVRTGGTCCDATVNWSYTQRGTLRPCSVVLSQVANGTQPSSTTIPQSIATPTAAVLAAGGQPTEVIVADVVYTLTPFAPLIDKLTSATIKKTTYMFPRGGGKVTLQSPVNPQSGQSGAVC